MPSAFLLMASATLERLQTKYAQAQEIISTIYKKPNKPIDTPTESSSSPRKSIDIDTAPPKKVSRKKAVTPASDIETQPPRTIPTIPPAPPADHERPAMSPELRP